MTHSLVLLLFSIFEIRLCCALGSCFCVFFGINLLLFLKVCIWVLPSTHHSCDSPSLEEPASTTSLSLRLGLKLSGDPEKSHSYSAIGLDCWGTSHDTPFLMLLSSIILLSLTCVSLSEQLSLVWCYGA